MRTLALEPLFQVNPEKELQFQHWNLSSFHLLSDSTLGSPARQYSNTGTFKHGPQWTVVDPVPEVPRVPESPGPLSKELAAFAGAQSPWGQSWALLSTACCLVLLTAGPMQGDMGTCVQ